MKIIYNPPNGSKIENFVFSGEGKLEPHNVGELKQYKPEIAEVLLKTFEFLEEVSAQRAQEIMEKPKQGSFKCEYCEFTTDHKVALAGHMRSHQDEVAKSKEPQIDPQIIPMAQSTPVEPRINTEEATKDIDEMKGPDWYGPGLTEERGTLNE